MDTVAKHLSQEMPVGMVVWGRYAFHFAFMLPFLLRRHPAEVVRVHRLGLVLLRGVQLLAATACFFTALRYIQLRSEERRVGQECVSHGGARWERYRDKKTKEKG